MCQLNIKTSTISFMTISTQSISAWLEFSLGTQTFNPITVTYCPVRPHAGKRNRLKLAGESFLAESEKYSIYIYRERERLRGVTRKAGSALWIQSELQPSGSPWLRNPSTPKSKYISQKYSIICKIFSPLISFQNLVLHSLYLVFV